MINTDNSPRQCISSGWVQFTGILTSPSAPAEITCGLSSELSSARQRQIWIYSIVFDYVHTRPWPFILQILLIWKWFHHTESSQTKSNTLLLLSSHHSSPIWLFSRTILFYFTSWLFFQTISSQSLSGAFSPSLCLTLIRSCGWYLSRSALIFHSASASH